MLTDLSFLNINQPWPPQDESDRLQQYQTNKQLFEGNHATVYADQFHRIERVIGNFQDVLSYAVLSNYQKIISLKTADLLLGEAPQIKCCKDGTPEQNTVDEIIENSDLVNTAYQTAIDISRYGDGLFFIYKDADTGMGKIDITQPSIWFPVVSPDNLKKFQYHVLAWRFDMDRPQATGFWQQFFDSFKSDKQSFLKVQIHSKGSYEERLYLLEPGTTTTIKEFISSKTVNTGLDDFAIVQVSNIITSDRTTGLDDYKDIDSLVSELEVRVSQVARILDKHAAPSVEGPSTAIERDPRTGQYQLKMGNYFPRDSNDDPEVKYITWDAQLEANFKIIDKIINILYTISEMGNTIFGDMDGQKSSGAMSGIALRRLMISPLAKVNRIRMRMDSALKKALKLCSQLGGENIVDISKEKISIIWQDGLPKDELEQAQITQIRTGNKPTMSQFRAIQQQDNLSDTDTQTELDRIDDDETKSNPVSGGNAPFSGDNSGGEG